MANAIALSRSQSQDGRGYGGGETYVGDGSNAPGDYYEQSIPTPMNLDDDEEEEDKEEEEDEQ